MDKYEYKHLMEEIKSLIDQGKYADAVAIADQIDWRRVKNIMTLGTISDLYKINCRYEDARDILLFAYDRKPQSRQVCYSLCEMYCKTGEPVEAAEFYKEFEKLAPKDPGRYILKYKVYDAFGASIDEKIEVLEKLKEEEYQEKWMYELAKLYHRRGLATKCVETCDELVLWFGVGKYVNMALELKMLHEPLTADQQRIYENRFLDKTDQLPTYATEADGMEPAEGEHPENAGMDYPTDDTKVMYSADDMRETYSADDVKGMYPTDDTKVMYSMDDTKVMYDADDTKVIPAQDMMQEMAREMEEQMLEQERLQAQADIENAQEGGVSDATRMFDVEEVRRQLKEQNAKQSDPQDELDIQVKTVDVDSKYNTMNLQAEIAKGLQEILGEESVPVEADGEVRENEKLSTTEEFETDWAEPQEHYEDDINKQVMADMRKESMESLKKQAMIAQPPEPMAKVLTQESDGQIRLVVPEGRHLEKQITGQMSIEDIRAEWERMKQENKAKQEEEVRQQVLRQTGRMFTEFEEKIRDSILQKMEDANFDLPKVQEPAPESDSFEMDSLGEEGNEFIGFADPAEFQFEEQAQDIETESEESAGDMTEAEVAEAEIAEAEADDEDTDEEVTEAEAAEEVAEAEADDEGAGEEVTEAEAEDEAAEDESAESEEDTMQDATEPEGKAETAESPKQMELEDIWEEEDAWGEEPNARDLMPEGREQENTTEMPAAAVPEVAAEQEAVVPMEDGNIDFESLPVEDEEYQEGVADRARNSAGENTEGDEGGLDYEECSFEEEESEDGNPGDGEPEESKESEETEEVEETEEAEAEADQEEDLEAEQGQKLPVRELTKEEEAIYGSLVQGRTTREQLVQAIDAISMAPYTGNVIITGEADMNTLELAKKIICEVKASDSNFVGTVAKISGKALGSRNVTELLMGLKCGALIIEKPIAMSDESVRELYDNLQAENFGIIVFLLDSKKGINGFFKKHEELKPMFNAHVHMKPLSEEVLADYARQYAYDNEFTIDSMGLLALHTRIDEMQTAKHAATFEDVKEIMDDAIYSASRISIGHFFDILFGRRYDEEDMIYITEKDFR